METFYVTKSEFWDWFDRDKRLADCEDPRSTTPTKLTGAPKSTTPSSKTSDSGRGQKRMKTDHNKPLRNILETEAAVRADARYIILFGPHKPGKKNKTWTGDGYLTMVGEMAHLCDLKGKMLEEPTILDEIDMKAVNDHGELLIGGTEVQIVDVDE